MLVLDHAEFTMCITTTTARRRAVAAANAILGLSTAAAIAIVGLAIAAATPASADPNYALQFNGSNNYVTFGRADSLGAKQFTVETWFRREGAGVTTTTGSGGVTAAIPLVTKGRGEAEASNVDMNYFLGIRGTDGVLCADYEEGSGQTQPGLNHPVVGVTRASYNTWHHAAVTYDGSVLKLYLNGNLEAQVTGLSGRLPRWDSIQHAALATAMNSTGVAAGYFAGRLDEPRIWNYARTQQEIRDGMVIEITSGAGLRGRWGLNENAGTTAYNSITTAPNGTLVNNPLWVTGTTFAIPSALYFAGTNDYVTFGDPAALDLGQFTLECWFRRDGAGIAASTGTGGVTAIPLVTKGRGEAEASNVDMNYFLGIRQSDAVLCADFEEGAGGTSPGLNHPVAGVTPLATGTWYHAAVTYDGTTWKLYLNGALETELEIGQPPQSVSIQHAGLGTALNSTGVTSGFLNGVLDEARIWDHARTGPEIAATVNTQISTPQMGLVARWSLDEASGSAVNGSAGTTVNGTINGTGWGWVAGAPFNVTPPAPPAAPTSLTATAISHGQIRLDWTDASNNETAFEIERSTTGSGGPFTLLATVGQGVQLYYDSNLDPYMEYCYRVRAKNSVGYSDYAGPACATTPVEGAHALDFTGTDGYVTFGQAPALGLPEFTLECWFRRDGAGTTTSTGTNGILDAIPLVTKGRGEQEGGSYDTNYFFGLDESDSVIVADFEEGSEGVSPGRNHPVSGITKIQTGTWYHAAATYDGDTWRLYLNGQLETEFAVGQPPQSQSAQHAAIASALTTTGVAQGFFDGVIDEVRIWDHARTLSEIRTTINSEVTSAQTDLVARWGLNEGTGTSVDGGAGTAVLGTLAGTGWSWVTPGAPFDLVINDPPSPPALVRPLDDAIDVPVPVTLEVTVTDPESDSMTVRFYGRPVLEQQPADFALIGLPDTQYYTATLNGGSPVIFGAQTQWIVDNRAARNIAFVSHFGDVVESGDNGGDPVQWQNADTAMGLLENPITTQLPYGIPYGMTVGNHDQTPNGDPTGTTTFYNQYFGASRFSGRPYFGGQYDSNTDNHFELFSASGLDFICIDLEYDNTPDAAVLAWADSLLTAYSTRRAIIGCHYLMNVGTQASFGTQGQVIYDTLKGHSNLFLMLCGHSTGEGRRVDTYAGNTVYTLLADYQSRSNGGDGWLRILEFSPAYDVIHVKTYSPTLGQYETDGDSQFDLPYTMVGGAGFQLIGTVTGVPSGSNASVEWPGLTAETQYEWYAVANDAENTRQSTTWSFTTSAGDLEAPSVHVASPNGAEIVSIYAPATITWTATDNVGVTTVDIELSRSGAGGPFESLAAGVPNSGSYEWPVTGPVTTDAYIRVTAHDAASNSGSDLSDAAFEITETVSGIEEGGPVTEFALRPVAPNPLIGAGRIVYAVPVASPVSIRVVDVRGRIVARLVDGVRAPGRYAIGWNGTTRGTRLPGGVYFVQMQAGGKRFTQRVMVVQ